MTLIKRYKKGSSLARATTVYSPGGYDSDANPATRYRAYANVTLIKGNLALVQQFIITKQEAHIYIYSYISNNGYNFNITTNHFMRTYPNLMHFSVR